MSIAVETGLLSGKAATVTAGLDETVQTLSRRAQITLGAGKGRLLDSSGVVLDGSQAITNTGIQNGSSLTLHVNGLKVQATRWRLRCHPWRWIGRDLGFCWFWWRQQRCAGSADRMCSRSKPSLPSLAMDLS